MRTETNFHRNLEEHHEIMKPFPETSIAEIAHALAQELKIVFEQSLPNSLTSEALSVEVYDRTSDVHTRIADLQTDEAAQNLPAKDVALVVIRFPEPLAHHPDNLPKDIANTKDAMTRRFWHVRDIYQERYNLDIERVNPVAEHSDAPLTGYYYIWLITPHGKMPEQFLLNALETQEHS